MDDEVGETKPHKGRRCRTAPAGWPPVSLVRPESMPMSLLGATGRRNGIKVMRSVFWPFGSLLTGIAWLTGGSEEVNYIHAQPLPKFAHVEITNSLPNFTEKCTI